MAGSASGQPARRGGGLSAADALAVKYQQAAAACYKAAREARDRGTVSKQAVALQRYSAWVSALSRGERLK